MLTSGATPTAIYDWLRLEHSDFAPGLSAIKRMCLRLGRERGVRAEDVAILVETAPGEVAQALEEWPPLFHDPLLAGDHRRPRAAHAAGRRSLDHRLRRASFEYQAQRDRTYDEGPSPGRVAVRRRPIEAMAKEIADVEGAAELFGVSPWTIYLLARTGKLPATRVGREWRLARASSSGSRTAPRRTSSRRCFLGRGRRSADSEVSGSRRRNGGGVACLASAVFSLVRRGPRRLFSSGRPHRAAGMRMTELGGQLQE